MAANSHLTRLSFGGFNLVKITTNEMERKVTLVCNTLVLSGRYKRLGLESAVRTGVSRLGQTNPSVFPSTNHKRWTPLTSRDPNSGVPGSQERVFQDGLNGRNVRRDTTSAVRFEVYAFPAPLKLFAKLPMPKECYLAGTPPFTLVIEYSTGREQIITFDRSRTGVSSFWNDMHGVYQLISCEDAETGGKVNCPASFSCFHSEPHPEFPDVDDFVEVGPGQIWFSNRP